MWLILLVDEGDMLIIARLALLRHRINRFEYILLVFEKSTKKVLIGVVHTGVVKMSSIMFEIASQMTPTS